VNCLGVFIKNERKKRNMSLRAFSERCNISHTHLDSIEKGKDFRTGKQVSVTIDTLIKIATYLNVKPEFLTALIYKDDSLKNYKNEQNYNDNEKQLLDYYNVCDEIDKVRILTYAEAVAENKHKI